MIQTLIFEGINPMGAVRVTRKQAIYGGNKAYNRYREYKNEIARQAIEQGVYMFPKDKPIVIKRVKFCMPIPKSRYKTTEGNDPHLVTPDLDNLIKGLKDALNGVVWHDDKVVYAYEKCEKVYSSYPGIAVTFECEEVKR